MSDSYVTLWTVARQAPLSVGFLRQEYWGESPFLSPGDLPDSGIESASPALQEDSLLLSHQGALQAENHLTPSYFKQKDNLKHLQTPTYLISYFL